MTKRIFLALTAATLFTSLLAADDHDDRNKVPLTPAQQVARTVARLTVRLNLTTTQQAQATAIFTTEQAALGALVIPRQAARASLQTAIRSNSAASIQSQALALGRLEEQQVLADATAEAAFYAILTPAQQTTYSNRKLAELNEDDN